MNNFLAVLEFCAFYIEYKNAKLTGINFVVELMLNILCKHSFSYFVKISQKFLPSLVKITTKSTHFVPAKKKIPWSYGIITP